MRLEQMLQTVEAGLFRFGHLLCRGLRAEIGDQVEQVTAELKHECERLRACRRQLDEVRLRVKQHEARVAQLGSHIESFLYVHDGPRAFEHALELDRRRGALADDRRELRRLLADEGKALDEVRRLRSRLDELKAKLAALG